MDVLLDQHFLRVEAALNALIDSITSYNPSHQAVLDLLAADDDLSRGLEQLAVHQANYQRILALRQTADTLDAQVKSTLTTLADTRKELINTPASTTTANTRDVGTQELLAYAKHIGKFTVPPNYRPPPTKEEAAVQEKPDEDVVMTNGTPAAAAQQQQPDGPAAPEETRTMATLSAEQKTWLAGLSALPFVPWPTEDKIRLGALGQIQTMVEQGRDPTTVLSPEEQAERARKAAEEEEERRKEEERQRAEADRRRRESYAAGGGQGGGQAQAQAQAEQFNLDLY
ncbi:uncharacterized protein K452DRAFT_282345 [Aplosporella prunicola CBS 121167]|uniref:Mediator of RNA polymerase II transcription subunit 4 n=1 Tax=Aplosporella prunicola CBS 121167 TaxID=1176127 RepID=A0A6A6BT96_9PEZI|nr:uncharacterized protein K452DRAFT_282345 [Aplosporella prunicola CBS 121167]KAF2147339.1 hypothetical protein K452DRAFT_282345 [Aplosporella prunicola CBS 121167]